MKKFEGEMMTISAVFHRIHDPHIHIAKVLKTHNFR